MSLKTIFIAVVVLTIVGLGVITACGSDPKTNDAASIQEDVSTPNPSVKDIASTPEDATRALESYNEELLRYQQTGDKASEAATLNKIGLVYSALGDKQQALDYYSQALPLSQQAGDIIGEATALNNIGGVVSSQYFGAKETRFFVSPLRGAQIFGKTWFLLQIIEKILL